MNHIAVWFKDFDTWEKQGCKGWSYKDVLPYFIKSEDCRIPDIAQNGYHGVGGPLTVSTPGHVTFMTEMIFDIMKSFGYKEVDYNGETQTGYSRIQQNIRDGRRCSVEKAFLRPAKDRPNLHIIPFAFVTKIELDENKKAKFVIFQKDTFTHKVEALKEVILSAGGFSSPQLLMLSGIGPKEHLEEIGIPVVVNLPGVGQNYHDHVVGLGPIVMLNKSLVFTDGLRKYANEEEKYKKSLSGILTVPGGTETVSFVHTKFSNRNEDFPDIMMLFAGVPYVEPFTYLNKDLKRWFSPYMQESGVTIIPILQRPKSRGFIKLRSADPYDEPIVDPRYFSEKEDLDVMADGMRIAKEIADSRQFQEMRTNFLMESLPGCTQHTLWSEDYMKCVAQTLGITGYHPVGSCKMGDPDDPSTVVDHELRVKGVKGLRVADASIMPSIVSANTNAACIMIGEKAADLIKMDTK